MSLIIFDKNSTLIQSGQQDALDKIIVDDDMKEEALKLVNDNNDIACEFFNKHETILSILKCIFYSISIFHLLFVYFVSHFIFELLEDVSTVQLEPEKKSDDELEDIIGRMDFAKDAISLIIIQTLRLLNYTCFYHFDHFFKYREVFLLFGVHYYNQRIVITWRSYFLF